MSLIDNINSAVTNAMKNRNAFNLSVLRMLKSALQTEKISKKHDLSDDEVIAVIKRQVKLRKDSIDEYTKYNRLDEVESLNNEISVLSKYLPEEMPLEEIEKVLDEVFAEETDLSIKSMGNIMKKLTSILGAKADMKKVSELVRTRLSK